MNITAHDWQTLLAANVDDMYADRISFVEFENRQRTMWAWIEKQGIESDVTKIITDNIDKVAVTK